MKARADYAALLESLAAGQRLLPEVTGILPGLEGSAAFTTPELLQLRSRTVTAYAARVLADDILSQSEEDEFFAFASALGVKSMQSEYPAILSRMVVAKCNDGRLGSISDPKLMAKRGEQVHLETNASLLKEQAIKEYQGRSSGVSFRVMKGVRYHVGGSRGRLVQVGTQIVTDDVGSVSISSQRVVFLGNKSTIDIPYARLVGMNLYSDGIRFNISNRKTAPILKLEDPDVVAAVINAAMQKVEVA